MFLKIVHIYRTVFYINNIFIIIYYKLQLCYLHNGVIIDNP